MKLRINRFLVVGLIITSMALNACSEMQNQMPTSRPSPTLATSTPVPLSLTATLTLTVTPVSPPTSWINALLTTTPTLMYPLPTLPPDCGTVQLGHAGTQTIDRPQKILIQGTAILCGQSYLDGNFVYPLPVVDAMLDLDSAVFDLESSDLFMCPSGGTTTFFYYCEVNNSKIREYGITSNNMNQPSFEDCSQIILPHESTNDSEPLYICVITNQGNVSRVKVEKVYPVSGTGTSEEISFITWEK